jgi:uncharacterized membrane protein
MIENLNKKLTQFIPKGRIKSLDILRGLAILQMTLVHQTLPFGLHSTTVGHQLFIIGAYYTRPLFIAVSGIALVLHEQKYRWPFRMVVHGSVLFAMAWSVDIVFHRSLAVDWDIFQVIGACYAIAGLFSYLRNGKIKCLAILSLIVIWAFAPVLRPDRGLFPIWPNGIYFVGGYLIGKWGLSQYARSSNAILLFLISIVCLSSFYVYVEPVIHLSTNTVGISASFAAIFLLLCLSLYLERKQLADRFPLSFMLRFGRYPLSLYFIQQFVAVFGLKLNLRLTLTENPNIDCTLQTSILLFVMYGATFILDRFKFFSIEFWLRKAESFIMNAIPQISIFNPLPPK